MTWVRYRPKYPSAEERFWARVKKTDSCWLWERPQSRGYGSFLVNGRPMRAHVYSYVLHNGEIPAGLEVCHNCPGGDNRACVNPAHLFLGTHAENMADAAVKGTMCSRPVESHALSKLTDSDVRTIRKLAEEGLTRREIGKQFGVTPENISAIVLRRTWRHV